METLVFKLLIHKTTPTFLYVLTHNRDYALTSRLHVDRIQLYYFPCTTAAVEGDGGQLMVGSIMISKAQTS